MVINAEQKELKGGFLDLKRGQQELKEGHQDLKYGQKVLQKDVSSIKDNLINGLGPYFKQIEKHIDTRTDELKDVLGDQQRVIDTLAARSIKHESEIKDFKHILKNQ
ncbi:hypothetical protein LC048_10685 [Mesobacillus subterraneus]|uniref:hypothetical protein n=1 Tax=Mesobacillus subterraneus TaxID=285983 RepID=UPI001CFC5B8D|nr:hypothetical protein [Mesobacillus subterraneus]WLR57278.1 hypothetical protein LC048_10685 [Mesobacillus subterraneus]